MINQSQTKNKLQKPDLYTRPGQDLNLNRRHEFKMEYFIHCIIIYKVLSYDINCGNQLLLGKNHKHFLKIPCNTNYL